MNSLDEVLGLGYSGYSLINSIPVLMLPSSLVETENMILSEGSWSNNLSTIGKLPVKGRRSLTGSISFVATAQSLSLISTLLS